MQFDSILAAIFHYASVQPDKLCLADTKGSLTYSEYKQRICGVAGELLRLGVKKGDRVVAKALQTKEYLTLLQAVQLIGAVFVPLEKSVSSGRINEIIDRTGAVLYAGDKPTEGTAFLDYRTLELTADDSGFELPADTGADSMILFTTGTTGKSKGIVLSYASEVAVAENVVCGVEMKPDNVEILPMPLNHSMNLRRYFANMINGSSVVIIDGVVFFSVFYGMMEKYRATSFTVAPAALSILFKLSGDRLADYASQLDYVQLGSAPIPESDKNRLAELLPSSRLYNMYGSTEAGCACVLNFNSPENRPHCIGYPTKNSHFEIRDENGRPVSSGENKIGFLRYGGSMCMKGYLDEPELTAETMSGNMIKTSDNGMIDADGRIYMLGRADDVIMSGGNKIAPSEVEDIALEFPGITECACFGADDALLGKIPVLLTVSQKALDTKALSDYLKDRLEGFKQPKRIVRVEALPKTYNGKLLRSKLAEAYAAAEK